MSPTIREREWLLANVVIESINTWSNFCRSYYLSCWLNPKTRNHTYIYITHTFVDYNNAIGVAIHYVRPAITAPLSGIWHRRDEPAWHDHNILMRLCQLVGCSHLPNIQSSFSFGSRVFVDLPVFRNYYAHRNQQTSAAASNIAPQYGVASRLRPSQILLSRPVGRPQQLILDFIDDLIATADLLCD